jgi:hypothetical protein
MGLKPDTLHLWRQSGRIPFSFIRMGKKKILFRLSDVETYVAANTVTGGVEE